MASTSESAASLSLHADNAKTDAANVNVNTDFSCLIAPNYHLAAVVTIPQTFRKQKWFPY